MAYLFSHSVGREGLCKRITLACVRSVSATLGLPPLMVHTAQALGCSARNRLRLALSCMYLPGLSCSGSGAQVVLRGADLLGLRFVPFAGPSSSAVWQPRSLRLIASPLPTSRFSGCTAGAPSQADDDRPEPQEVLVSKEACCSLVVYVSQGLLWPTSGLPALAACHRRGMVCSWLILFCPLFCAWSWWCLMFELFTW